MAKFTNIYCKSTTIIERNNFELPKSATAEISVPIVHLVWILCRIPNACHDCSCLQGKDPKPTQTYPTSVRRIHKKASAHPFNEILTHFELLSPSKFSTEEASFYFLNNSMEQIRNNCVISFDLSKEFDTINRDLLLIK